MRVDNDMLLLAYHSLHACSARTLFTALAIALGVPHPPLGARGL
jgi:hypothetical protein